MKDIQKLQNSLRTVIKVAYHNATTEGTHLFNDFASVTRLVLADAAELLETQASKAKETLRHVEQGVQEGKKDSLGRDKERLEAERGDTKVAWEHGMDTVKDAGSTVIGATQNVRGAIQDQTEQTTHRLQDAFYSVRSPPPPQKYLKSLELTAMF